uniref:F-box domain-containing protein n=1 Tax=Triticum urartu TaxID=4572 RepID=A0A8R7UML6_TRIUA
LSPELVEEVFFRLPPDEPACLVRASAVCKPWRLILADSGFGRRYREFHGTPPVLGFFQKDVSFFPISALPTAQPNDPRWVPLDCRHGRSLFAFDPAYRNVVEGGTVGLIIWDPLTGQGRRLPSPADDTLGVLRFTFSAAVFCAAQGCDHHGCQGGHYRVVIVTTNQRQSVTSGWLFSSETRAWSELTSVHHPNVEYTHNLGAPSVIVGDTLYFNIGGILKCQLGTLRLSMFEKPIDGNGRLMTPEDGRLGFAAVVDVTNLTLWSMQSGPVGATGWVKLRVIDLKRLLP